MPAVLTVLPTGCWAVDTSRTTVSLAVRNGPRTVHGTVPVTAGTIVRQQSPARHDAPTRDEAMVRVEAELDLSAIDTGNARRDRDLRKPGLLDLDRHPTMRFTADTVSGQGAGWLLSGSLHVRGRDVPLALRITETADGPAAGELIVVATTSLDRRAVGLVAPPFIIGRRVEVTIRATLARCG